MLPDFVRSDSVISGTSLVNRIGLESLMADARRGQRPFDCLLIDDTSRFGRNLTDVLRMSEVLQHQDIFLYFVSQALDSREKNFRQLLVMNGLIDEQYSKGLSDKVKRGQQGRLLNGYNPGGKCYGYANVVDEDFTRRGEYGRPAIKGVKQVTIYAEVQIVLRIYEMRAAGKSLNMIAKLLNAENIPPPSNSRGRGVPSWGPSCLFAMLRNERYRGRIIWGRTRKTRNPDTGRKAQRDTPEADWTRTEIPQLRIISEELWGQVQEMNITRASRWPWSRLGGFAKAESIYLFSGLLECGLCGRSMVIVSGQKPYAAYGCPSHRNRGCMFERDHDSE